jgi:hypothetical protein
LGEAYSQASPTVDLGLATFYTGGDWSRDGSLGVHQLDCPSSSAIHFAQEVCSKVAAKDAVLYNKYGARIRNFSVQFLHCSEEVGMASEGIVYRFTLSITGPAIPFGRSSTHFFAMPGF